MQIFPWLDRTNQLADEDFYRSLHDSLNEEAIKNLNTHFSQADTKAPLYLHQTITCSLFARELILQTPTLLLDLLNDAYYLKTQPLAAIHTSLLKGIVPSHSFDAQVFQTEALTLPAGVFDKQLRDQRNAYMLRIIWRDLNRLSSLEETTTELSLLAEAIVQLTLSYHYALMSVKYGSPKNSQGQTIPMLVLGMGKLGAYELNLSSDIDLIFAYPHKGQTDHPKKSINNQEFFTRLGQKIIHSIDAPNADGFVFRVDMRLRPYGQSGALACSFNAMEDYYQTQGREWERYAMVKARVIANNGDQDYTQQLNRLLKQFTYRKYIDFSVIDALRSLKVAISQEVSRRRLIDDIKLGSGGIREIEFITQSFQLIRGGREPELQDNRLMHILPLLEKGKYLPVGVSKKLIDAYTFLRNTEHAIQAYRDKQTQTLPTQDIAQKALTMAMGFNTWEMFYTTLKAHQERVHEEFKAVISHRDDDTHENSELSQWTMIWNQSQSAQDIIEPLHLGGFNDPESSAKMLSCFRDYIDSHPIQEAGRSRLDLFMPQLLSEVSTRSNPCITLERILPFVRNVTRRSAYLLLLIENPKALDQLVRLSQASPWICEQISTHPALLDELIDTRSLYQLPDKQTLLDELRQVLLRIEPDDLEEQMNALRYFRSSHALRVAACEITGVLPLMKVSDYLSFIAEAILDVSLQLAWQIMTKKHGFPDGSPDHAPPSQAPFIIVGYGKLGGIELSHGSDLDLVFIYNSSAHGTTDGARRIDNQTFFVRLGQKIIHILTTHTAAGDLYDVDMRLRPSGNSGLLTTHLTAFKKYQENDAWTWEHQALVRARVVAGDPKLTEDFNRIRYDLLSRKRDLDQLKADVIHMRQKMRTHLGHDIHNDGRTSFDLKQDTGGIVDIEFMVQYAVLAWSNADPALMTYTDNIRILECLARISRLSTQEVDQLTQAYKTFRSLGHRLTLQQKSNVIDATKLVEERQNTQKIWQQWLNTTTN